MKPLIPHSWCDLCGHDFHRPGEGLNDGDRVMVLTKCGDAVFDLETFPSGAGAVRRMGGFFFIKCQGVPKSYYFLNPWLVKPYQTY